MTQMNELPTAVIFDVDGTLCDVRSIKHYLREDPRNFTKFFPETISCPPHQAVLDLIPAVRAAGHVPIVATARSENHRDITARWLEVNGVDHDELFMRQNDPEHKLPDDVAKEAILADIRARYRPVYAVEDNPIVVDLWTRHNIPVLVIPGFHGELGDAGAVKIENPFFG